MTEAIEIQENAIKSATTPAVRDFIAFAKTLPQVPWEHTHFFTPGLYMRTIMMRRDVVFVSEIHKNEHPYIITEGAVSVWTKADGWKTLTAPFFGVTNPGTLRVLRTWSDTVWTTFHANPDDGKDLEVIRQRTVVPLGDISETLDMNSILSKLFQGGAA